MQVIHKTDKWGRPVALTDFEVERAQRLRIIANELGCYLVSDIEALTDLSADTLANMRAKGKGPDYIYFGRTVLYPKELVHAFIRSNVGQRSSKSRPQTRKIDQDGKAEL